MKIAFAYLVAAVCFLGCSNKQPGKELVEGSPEYQLAEDLSTKLGYMDPTQNGVLVSTEKFDVVVADVCSMIRLNYGKNISQVTALDQNRLEQIIQQIAENLAERKLLLAAADETQTTAPQAVTDSVLSQQFLRAGSEEAFREMLTQNNVDFDAVSENIREGVTIDRYLDLALADQTVITDEEIQQAYQEDKTASVRHILLTTEGQSDSAKQATLHKMEDILARARAGEDFAELAKQYTEDPGSKNTGGLYNDFGRGRMVKPFEEAAFSVPVGQISDIVETAYGYHILKVVDRKKETRPLEEIRPEIEERFQREKKAAAYKEHIEDLKKSAGYRLVAF